jgi:hypothetical protein
MAVLDFEVRAMSMPNALYGLIQFSAAPERFEFVNIGVLLLDEKRRYFGLRFAQSAKRLDRMFGRQQRPYLSALKQGIGNRLRAELGSEWNIDRLQAFVRSRANDVRISKLQPILVDDPDADLDELFRSLVNDEEAIPRLPKVAIELGKRLKLAGVAKLVEKPKPIELPQGCNYRSAVCVPKRVLQSHRPGSSQWSAERCSCSSEQASCTRPMAPRIFSEPLLTGPVSCRWGNW